MDSGGLDSGGLGSDWLDGGWLVPGNKYHPLRTQGGKGPSKTTGGALTWRCSATDLHYNITSEEALAAERLYPGLFIGNVLYSFNFFFLLIQALAPEENSLGWL